MWMKQMESSFCVVLWKMRNLRGHSMIYLNDLSRSFYITLISEYGHAHLSSGRSLLFAWDTGRTGQDERWSKTAATRWIPRRCSGPSPHPSCKSCEKKIVSSRAGRWRLPRREVNARRFREINRREFFRFPSPSSERRAVHYSLPRRRRRPDYIAIGMRDTLVSRGQSRSGRELVRSSRHRSSLPYCFFTLARDASLPLFSPLSLISVSLSLSLFVRRHLALLQEFFFKTAKPFDAVG